jgi:site-specific DNA recombinase
MDQSSNLEQAATETERLLTALQGKVNDDMPFEDKREIVKTLVNQITVDTITDEQGRKKADVTINFFV